jgi:hypothetical protein
VDHPGAPPRSDSTPIAAGGMHLRFGVVSITGNVRQHNEDNFWVPPRPGAAGAGIPWDADAGTTADFPSTDFSEGPPACSSWPTAWAGSSPARRPARWPSS